MAVVPMKPALYEAKLFQTHTELGDFKAAGTLCGHIDFVGPWKGTYTLSPDEAQAVAVMLQNARADVLEHSRPFSDPRLIP